MGHPALAAGRTAVVTGGASGIGLACAKRLAARGLNVVIADLAGPALADAKAAVAALAAGGAVETTAFDVSRRDDLERLRDFAKQRFGEVGVLMNNAAVSPSRAPPGRITNPGGASSTSISGASCTACRRSRRC